MRLLNTLVIALLVLLFMAPHAQATVIKERKANIGELITGALFVTKLSPAQAGVLRTALSAIPDSPDSPQGLRKVDDVASDFYRQLFVNRQTIPDPAVEIAATLTSLSTALSNGTITGLQHAECQGILSNASSVLTELSTTGISIGVYGLVESLITDANDRFADALASNLAAGLDIDQLIQRLNRSILEANIPSSQKDNLASQLADVLKEKIEHSNAAGQVNSVDAQKLQIKLGSIAHALEKAVSASPGPGTIATDDLPNMKRRVEDGCKNLKISASEETVLLHRIAAYALMKEAVNRLVSTPPAAITSLCQAVGKSVVRHLDRVLLHEAVNSEENIADRNSELFNRITIGAVSGLIDSQGQTKVLQMYERGLAKQIAYKASEDGLTLERRIECTKDLDRITAILNMGLLDTSSDKPDIALRLKTTKEFIKDYFEAGKISAALRDELEAERVRVSGVVQDLGGSPNLSISQAVALGMDLDQIAERLFHSH